MDEGNRSAPGDGFLYRIGYGDSATVKRAAKTSGDSETDDISAEGRDSLQ